MRKVQQSIRIRVVINTKLFYQEFLQTSTLDRWESLSRTFHGLANTAERAQEHGDDVSQEMKSLKKELQRLKKHLVAGATASTSDRQFLNEQVKAAQDKLIARFGDA